MGTEPLSRNWWTPESGRLLKSPPMIMGMSSGLVVMRFSLEAKNLMEESWESKRGGLRSMKGLVGLLSEVLRRRVFWCDYWKKKLRCLLECQRYQEGYSN